METTMNLVKRAQNSDKKAMEELVEQFQPLIRKHSYYNGKMDENIFQELNQRLVVCIRKFH